jgi:Cdc6-like AAA superfamily ATPase
MTRRSDKLKSLRLVITENLRVQRGGSKSIPYVDIANVLGDITTRQNHAIFGRRGCGKTLLIHFSTQQLDDSIRCIYLNCEDFKKHSFPNVLIQILDALFAELQSNLTGWFGRKKRSRQLIETIRSKLAELRSSADTKEQQIREQTSSDRSRKNEVAGGISNEYSSLKAGTSATSSYRTEIEKSYSRHDDKLRELDMWLPELKRQIREFFALSTSR